MAIQVLLDADRFVAEGRKYIKQLAYCAPELGKFGCHTFGLPRTLGRYRRVFYGQARHSHGLVWDSAGIYRYDQVKESLQDIFDLLMVPVTDLEFYSKGREKCLLLEEFLPKVHNLEDLECPRYDTLTTLPQGTLSKALIFGRWLQSQTSLPQPGSIVL
jgi:hypothetical protein